MQTAFGGVDKNRFAKNTGALTLGVCVFIVFLFSAAFAFIHSDHEHDHHGPGGSCAACVQAATAKSFMKQLIVPCALIAAAACLCFGRLDIRPIGLCAITLTPVQLRVRLND